MVSARRWLAGAPTPEPPNLRSFTPSYTLQVSAPCCLPGFQLGAHAWLLERSGDDGPERASADGRGGQRFARANQG